MECSVYITFRSLFVDNFYQPEYKSTTIYPLVILPYRIRPVPLLRAFYSHSAPIAASHACGELSEINPRRSRGALSLGFRINYDSYGHCFFFSPSPSFPRPIQSRKYEIALFALSSAPNLDCKLRRTSLARSSNLLSVSR